MIIRHTPSKVTVCDVKLLCGSAGHLYNFMVEIKTQLKIKMCTIKSNCLFQRNLKMVPQTSALNDIIKWNELVADEDLELVECDVLKIVIPAFVSSDMLKM